MYTIYLHECMRRWELRHGQVMTIARLARELGVPLRSLYALSRKRKRPKMKLLDSICVVLECELIHLVSYSKDN